MTFVTVNGTRLHVVDRGHGSGAVLLVHGNGLSSRSWLPQLEALSRNNRVVAPDLRGFGCSDRRTGPFTPVQLTDDLAQLIRLLEVAPVHAVGLSLGGLLCIGLAGRHPSLVRSLAVASSTGGLDPAWSQRVRAAARALSDGGLAAVFGPFADVAWSAAFRRAHPNVVATIDAELAGNDPDVVAAVLSTFAAVASELPIDAVRCPTLVVRGANDVACPRRMAAALTGAVPNGRLVELPGAGHLCNLEAPSAFTSALRRFWCSTAQLTVGAGDTAS